MELSREINEVVARFVAQVSALARGLAHSQLTGALGDRAARTVAANRTARAPARAGGRSSSGGRRTPAEIERLRDRLRAHIAAHPGERIEQIKVALDARTSELAVPLQKLIYADLVRTEGERRATRYYPAGAAAEPTTKKRVAAPRKPAKARAPAKTQTKAKTKARVASSKPAAEATPVNEAEPEPQPEPQPAAEPATDSVA